MSKSKLTQKEKAIRVFEEHGYNALSKESLVVPIKHFEEAGLPRLTNGGGYCRDSMWPGVTIRRWKMKELKEEHPEVYNSLMKAKQFVRTTGIVALQLCGERKNPTSQSIRTDIRETLKNTKSPFSGALTADMQIDHKDGRKDDTRLADIETQSVSDFQNTTRAENALKRSTCNKCKETDLRFDARELGYTVAQTIGGPKYTTCIGCYYYDPIAFRQVLVRISPITGD